MIHEHDLSVVELKSSSENKYFNNIKLNLPRDRFSKYIRSLYRFGLVYDY